MGKLCVPPRVDPEGGCVPGCYSDGQPNWCPDESRWWHCNGYPRDRLDQMLRVHEVQNPGHYNEIVLDVQELVKSWPMGVEAIVFPRSSAQYTRPEAERLLNSFVEAYGPAAAARTALLQLDLSNENDDPFSVPSEVPGSVVD